MLNTSRPWHWFWRATLSICACCFCAGCLWFLGTWYSAREQRRAIADLALLGVRTSYDFQCRKGVVYPTALERELMGDDFFFRVVRADLPRRMATDELLRDITRLPHLEEVIVIDSPVTHRGVANLAKLTRLTMLCVDGCQLTDDGLAIVGGLRSLGEVSLANMPITDRGIEHLMRLTGLVRVDLSGTRVTIKGVERICQLPRVQFVYVGADIIRDPAAIRLQRASSDRWIVGPGGLRPGDDPHSGEETNSAREAPGASGQ